MKLFNHTIQNLEQSLSYASKNNTVISNNISNGDTPNFKAQEVSFRNVLEEELALKTTNEKHIQSFIAQSPFKTVASHNTQYNHNGNNVDIDKEMSELAKNQIYYRGAVDQLNGKFGILNTVIRGGK